MPLEAQRERHVRRAVDPFDHRLPARDRVAVDRDDRSPNSQAGARAGEPAFTWPTSVLFASVAIPNATALASRITNVTTKFAIGPAPTIAKRCNGFLL